jgi:hypothetical protein
MKAPVLRSTLVVTASFGIFFGGGWGFMYFVSKILWSGFPQGSSEKFTISYQIKNEICL